MDDDDHYQQEKKYRILRRRYEHDQIKKRDIIYFENCQILLFYHWHLYLIHTLI